MEEQRPNTQFILLNMDKHFANQDLQRNQVWSNTSNTQSRTVALYFCLEVAQARHPDAPKGAGLKQRETQRGDENLGFGGQFFEGSERSRRCFPSRFSCLEPGSFKGLLHNSVEFLWFSVFSFLQPGVSPGVLSTLNSPPSAVGGCLPFRLQDNLFFTTTVDSSCDGNQVTTEATRIVFKSGKICLAFSRMSKEK